MYRNEFRARVLGEADAGHLTGARPAFRLVTLGRLALLSQSDGSDVLLSQRRKLALLSLLALSERPVSRDALVEMFWGDEPEDRGRHSLSNALSFFRHTLGHDAIAVRRADVVLGPGTPMSVDALELLAAAERRDHARVVALYTGPFLGDARVDGAGAFEAWAARERALIERAYLRACESECMSAATAHDWPRCGAVAAGWLDAAPMSLEAALHRLNALRATRTTDGRRAALAAYDALVERLRREYDAAPHSRVTQLAEQIAARLAADEAAAAAALTPALAESFAHHDGTYLPTTAAPHAGAPGEMAERRPAIAVADPAASAGAPAWPGGDAGVPGAPTVALTRTWRGARGLVSGASAIGVALALALVVALSGVYVRHRAVAGAVTADRPLIAVTDIVNIRGDTANAWLEDGLAQMVATDLARTPDVEVIAPARVRDTRMRAQLPMSGPLTGSQALNIARRLGARIAVRGGLTHGGGGYVLDLDLRDVRTGSLIRTVSVSASNPIALADRAAGQILEWSSARGARPRFADLETANVAAYEHFVRALQATDEGRFLEARRETDAAVALDSGFADALALRASQARDAGDSATLARVETALRTARRTPWNVLQDAADSAQHNGELARSEALARELVRRYPHDPRAYSELAQLYAYRGAWAALEATLRTQLALDSLATRAGSGPCVPCAVYHQLADAQMFRGDIAGGERTARRWLSLQPDLPAAWAVLAAALSYGGRYDAALDAERRAMLLSGNDPLYETRVARALVMARRFDAADSVARALATGPHATPQTRAGAADIRILVLRERGELRASIRATERQFAASGTVDDALVYEEMDALGRLGDYAGVLRLFRQRIGDPVHMRAAARALRGDAARWFCWTRTLEANALAGSGDTLRLRALADSIRVMSARSYYARDEHLASHVLGLIAMHAGRYAEAEREFSAARWGVAGFSATVAWLARAQLAQGHAAAAVATLRDAYEGPLDAMGRYQPRSELDNLMAIALQRAGMPARARVYAAFVTSAWQHADPEVRQNMFTGEGLPFPVSDAPARTGTPR